MARAGDELGGALVALADPLRREILWLGWDQARTAGDIADHFELAPNTISSHLRRLVDAGLLTMMREGTKRPYRTNIAALGRIHDELDRSFGYHLADRRHFGPGFQAAPVAGAHQATVIARVSSTAPEVWSLWTTRAGLDQLWGGRSRIDLRPGGALSIDVAGPPTLCIRGRLHQVSPPAGLRFSWCFALGEIPLPPGVASVTFTLDPCGPSTTDVRLTNYSTDASLLGYHEALWTAMLARQVDLSENGHSIREVPLPQSADRPRHRIPGASLTVTPRAMAAHGQVPRDRLVGSHRRWYVDGVHGSNGNDCETRQHACKTIAHAFTLTSRGDAIMVAPGTYPESLTIQRSVEIVGSGAAKTIIDGGGIAGEIITSNPSTTITVSGVTMRNGGSVGDGGGIYNCGSTVRIINSIISGNHVTRGPGTFGYGGGIYNCPGGTMAIINSTLRGNRADVGGAICNGGILTISGSTFSGNEARKQRGGGIFNYGHLTINNSTFSGNSALDGFGGAINNGRLFRSKGTLVINNSTLSRNIVGGGRGAGIFNLNGARATLQNSIMSDNAGRSCAGMVASDGYNLSGDDSCHFSQAGDVNNTDPRLGPLLDNGGPTQTMALLSESPAIDAGNPTGCMDSGGHQLKTDQRGEPRPDSEDAGGCDRGAYERQGD
jgi:DNA-binding transcriptional ArsR family regulator/uncharacterized protein YndB with AHSA1/START domain